MDVLKSGHSFTPHIPGPTHTDTPQFLYSWTRAHTRTLTESSGTPLKQHSFRHTNKVKHNLQNMHLSVSQQYKGC